MPVYLFNHISKTLRGKVMALTENTFTDAELISAVEANPALTAVIKTALGQKKFVVQDETEHQEFLNNYQNTEYKKKVIGEHTSEFALKLEKDVEELTGIKKTAPDEKYYDYFKRATGEKLKAVTTLQTELDKLKAGHNPSEADKARIATLEAAIEQKENDWKKKYDDKVGEISKIKAGSEFEKSLSKIRGSYKANIPQELIDTYEQNIVNSLMPNIRIQDDGTITIVDDKGEVILNKTTYKPVSIDEVVKEKAVSLIDPGKKQTGTGTGKDDVDDPAKKKGEFAGVPADVKSKVGLSNYLKTLGYIEGSEDFDKILEEHGKNLPLR